jgi:hypothetical protein
MAVPVFMSRPFIFFAPGGNSCRRHKADADLCPLALAPEINPNVQSAAVRIKERQHVSLWGFNARGGFGDFQKALKVRQNSYQSNIKEFSKDVYGE